MVATPVTFEQMQQFRAEVDGRIAAAKAENEASFQAASQANKDEIATVVEAKFAEVDGKFSALSGRVLELFGKQKTRMDAIANKVLEEEAAFDQRSQEFDAKMKELSDRIGAVGLKIWCALGETLRISRRSSTSIAPSCRRSSSRELGRRLASSCAANRKSLRGLMMSS